MALRVGYAVVAIASMIGVGILIAKAIRKCCHGDAGNGPENGANARDRNRRRDCGSLDKDGIETTAATPKPPDHAPNVEGSGHGL